MPILISAYWLVPVSQRSSAHGFGVSHSWGDDVAMSITRINDWKWEVSHSFSWARCIEIS
jgi:hypothetical protein